MDITTVLGIILSVSSITLSLVAIWFAWVSYKNSTDMQMKAQGILEQISQKVELIVDKTSHQIDRAWEYFTNTSKPLPNKTDESNFNVDELRKQIVEETKSETLKLIQDAGLDKSKIESLNTILADLVDKTTERTKEVFSKQLIIDRYSEIESEIKKWYERKLNWIFPPNINFVQMIHNKEINSKLPREVINNLMKFIETRNRIAHSKEVTLEEIDSALSFSSNFLDFLRS